MRGGNFIRCACHPMLPEPRHHFWEDLVCEGCSTTWAEQQVRPVPCPRQGQKRWHSSAEFRAERGKPLSTTVQRR